MCLHAKSLSKLTYDCLLLKVKYYYDLRQWFETGT
jgi:hypothetical protein